MNILPVIVVGAAIALFGRKKPRKRKLQDQLPPSSDLGELFAVEDPPDIIATNVGKRFTISHVVNMSTGHSWEFAASPPDNSVELIKAFMENLERDRPPGAPDGTRYYIFEAKKIGDGSLVFHLRGPGGKDNPPVEVVEIETRIS